MYSITHIESIDEELVHPRYILRKCYFNVVTILFLTQLLLQLDNGAKSHYFRSLSVPPEQYDLGEVTYLASYALFQIPATYVAVKAGAPFVLSFMVLTWGCITAASSAMKTSAQFFALRFFLGVTEAGFFPASWYHMSLFFNSFELGFAIALMSTATAISAVVAPGVAAGVLKMEGWNGLHSWQWGFILQGAATCWCGIMILALLPRGPGVAWFLTPAERTWLTTRLRRIDVAAEEIAPCRGYWTAAPRTWELWYLGACQLLLEMSTNAAILLAKPMVRTMFPSAPGSGEGGWSERLKAATFPGEALEQLRVTALAGIMWVPVVIAMVLLALTSLLARERRAHCAAPISVGAAALMLLPVALEYSGNRTAQGILVVAITCLDSVAGPFISWPKAILFGKGCTMGFGMLNTFWAIGRLLGFITMRSLIKVHLGYRVVMYLSGALAFVVAALLVGFHPKEVESKQLVDPASAKPEPSRSPAVFESQLSSLGVGTTFHVQGQDPTTHF
eukprot:jgi/Botrbrau1/5384/Bobra.0346s0045.1